MGPAPAPALSTVHAVPAALRTKLARAKAPETADEPSWNDATEAAVEWIVSIKPSAEDGLGHWFCGRGGWDAEGGWDAVVFSLRLLAFKPNGMIADWRDRLFHLLTNCPYCIEKYQTAKAEFVGE